MAEKLFSYQVVVAMKYAGVVVSLVVLGAACSKKEAVATDADVPSTEKRPAAAEQPTEGEPTTMLKLTSTAFEHQSNIAKRYTCQGQDVSPPLSWSGAPAGTQSFALIVDDPDAPDPAAPKTVWVHWVLYNLPADTSSLAEGTDELPTGTGEGLNDWKQTGYRGPCPPIGRHRYFFKLYALDTKLEGLSKPTKAQVEAGMEGHVLAKGELVGTCQKQ